MSTVAVVRDAAALAVVTERADGVAAGANPATTVLELATIVGPRAP